MKAPTAQTLLKLQEQLDRERRLVSFDSYDLSVKQLLDMFESSVIDIPPEYQRQFIWDERRQSSLVESVMLGIPIPNIFMATNPDSTWEIVDGVQRLGSLSHFAGNPPLLAKINKNDSLVVTGLEKLSALNGLGYLALPRPMKIMFDTRPVRVTVLNDKSDMNVRFDLFERLNTGGVSLTNQEIRNCIFRGPFNEGLKRLVKAPGFSAAVKLKPGDVGNGTAEELALRFFAFLENYESFDHSVKDFLNDYMKSKREKPVLRKSKAIFESTFNVLSNALPNGIVRGGRGVTPVNLYEAIAVGTALALEGGAAIDPAAVEFLLDDPKLRKFTTGGTNARGMVTGRINYVRDALL